jgi:hypothetical protein
MMKKWIGLNNVLSSKHACAQLEKFYCHLTSSMNSPVNDPGFVASFILYGLGNGASYLSWRSKMVQNGRKFSRDPMKLK